MDAGYAYDNYKFHKLKKSWADKVEKLKNPGDKVIIDECTTSQTVYDNIFDDVWHEEYSTTYTYVQYVGINPEFKCREYAFAGEDYVDKMKFVILGEW